MAAIDGRRASTEHLSQGLDRAALNVYTHADHHLVAPLRDGQDTSRKSSDTGEAADPNLASLNNLRRLSGKVKQKTVKAFQPLHKKQKSTDSETAPTLAPAPSGAADDARMYKPVPEQKGPDFKEVIKHPISSVQSALHGASGAKFSEALDNPVIAHGAEVSIVRAYDEVKSAKSEGAKESALVDLESLKKERQDAYVRWTFDRHVLKANEKKGIADMRWLDYGHNLLRYYVEHYGDQYIDRNPNLPEPSEEAFNTSMERLVMISTPYQMLVMRFRHIYRWENRTETALYLGAYAFFWAINYLAGAFILALIAVVLQRRLYPPTAEDIREDIIRSEDAERTALNLTQLIEQHGAHGWVEALRQDLGPWFLLQLEDIANVLEIWRNFYEWRDPKRTMISLILLVQVWLATTFIPLSMFIKLAQLSAGILFFGLFPIASRYPQYRLLASPMKWLFWKVPTDAEWAIARLQVEAAHRKEALRQISPSRDPDGDEQADSESGNDGEDEVSLGHFHCTSHSHHGDLCLTSKGVKYKTAVRSHVLWELHFDDITVLQKVGAGEGLLFVLASGEGHRVSGLKSRNEVFTQIIGYSGLRWQVTG
ncbi:MAG: hypothetical protein LQ348_005199 [Seirophora lacunosa]|nr:MAG: hypothetical protein LQ348_005199 [Seirophora lacunosa]